MWIQPHCGACDTGLYAPRPSSVLLDCTNPACDHKLHPRDFVNVDHWTVHQGTVWIDDRHL
ncbi:hypothetical protein [Streptomyces sp. NPDC059708]|uniref:hypothetical protein n=1 Tax=Streptomyces sp. NPDC059708 TaxID=3346916 RepID=UPI0036818254